MQAVYLPIRAFGDFIITAAVVKNYFDDKLPVIIPHYLTDFFKSISGNRYFSILGNINYYTQPKFFELYKVKDISNIKRLIKDLTIINASVNNDHNYLLDYSSRRLSFTGAKFLWPAKNENVYEGKLRLIKTHFNLKSKNGGNSLLNKDSKKIKNVIIIPDSRIELKTINPKLIVAITDNINDCKIKIGRFAKGIADDPLYINYDNFDKLTDIILNNDLIITAESLPYHLANFYNKPHFVIYNESRHFKTTFMTPFMVENNYYSVFTGLNFDEIVKDIKRILD